MKKLWESLKVEPVDSKVRRCESNWLRRVTRMNSSRMANIVLNCRPNGRIIDQMDEEDWKISEGIVRRG